MSVSPVLGCIQRLSIRSSDSATEFTYPARGSTYGNLCQLMSTYVNLLGQLIKNGGQLCHGRQFMCVRLLTGVHLWGVSIDEVSIHGCVSTYGVYPTRFDPRTKGFGFREEVSGVRFWGVGFWVWVFGFGARNDRCCPHLIHNIWLYNPFKMIIEKYCTLGRSQDVC